MVPYRSCLSHLNLSLTQVTPSLFVAVVYKMHGVGAVIHTYDMESCIVTMSNTSKEFKVESVQDEVKNLLTRINSGEAYGEQQLKERGGATSS